MVPLDKTLIAESPDADLAARQAEFIAELRETVAVQIGPIAKPREIVLVPDVPKTRSGKIMRRLLTQLFEGTTLGDTTSLQNEPCIPEINAICRARG